MESERDNIKRRVAWRMEFHVHTFFVSTMEMNGAELGLYLLTLHYAWANDARLPADEERLRRSLRYEKSEWDRIWPTVSKKWNKDGQWLTNQKLSLIYRESWERIVAAMRSGQKGGQAKAANANRGAGPSSDPSGDPSGDPSRVALPNPNPSHIRTNSSLEREAEAISEEGVAPRRARRTLPRKTTTTPFVAPTLAEVIEFWRENKLHGDPEKFHDTFENQRWRLSGGRGPTMKDWRLAARNWSRNETVNTRTVVHKNASDLERENEAEQLRRNARAREREQQDALARKKLLDADYERRLREKRQSEKETAP